MWDVNYVDGLEKVWLLSLDLKKLRNYLQKYLAAWKILDRECGKAMPIRRKVKIRYRMQAMGKQTKNDINKSMFQGSVRLDAEIQGWGTDDGRINWDI